MNVSKWPHLLCLNICSAAVDSREARAHDRRPRALRVAASWAKETAATTWANSAPPTVGRPDHHQGFPSVGLVLSCSPVSSTAETRWAGSVAPVIASFEPTGPEERNVQTRKLHPSLHAFGDVGVRRLHESRMLAGEASLVRGRASTTSMTCTLWKTAPQNRDMRRQYWLIDPKTLNPLARPRARRVNSLKLSVFPTSNEAHA
jgi:hypothetical protein